jgi:hypothetical protein
MNGPYRPLQSLDTPLRVLAWIIGLLTLAVVMFICWPLSLIALPIVTWRLFVRARSVAARPAARRNEHRESIARIWR